MIFINIITEIRLYFFLIITFFIFASNIMAKENSVIFVDRHIYAPGETILVSFRQAPGTNGDWICIVPAGAPDTEAGDYQYLPSGNSQGELTFIASTEGSYEARIYLDYRNHGYVVSGRAPFYVGEPAAEIQENELKKQRIREQVVPSQQSTSTGSGSFLQSVTSASGQAYIMVGETLTQMAPQYEGSAMGSAMQMAGKFHTDVGHALNNAAQNNSSPSQAFSDVNAAAYQSLQTSGLYNNDGTRSHIDSSQQTRWHNDIGIAQEKLQQQGYYFGNIDGIYGNNTANAIKDFQHDNMLPVTGLLDEETKISLNIDGFL